MIGWKSERISAKRKIQKQIAKLLAILVSQRAVYAKSWIKSWRWYYNTHKHIGINDQTTQEVSMGNQSATSEIWEQFHEGFVQNQIIFRVLRRGRLIDFGQKAREIIL